MEWFIKVAVAALFDPIIRFLVVLLLAFGASIIGTLLLPRSKALNSEQLSETAPDLAWISVKYPAWDSLRYVSILLAFLVPVGILWSTELRVPLIATGILMLFVSQLILEGVVTLSTGASPLHTRWSYRYIIGDKSRLRVVGYYQVIIGSGLAAITLIMVLKALLRA